MWNVDAYDFCRFLLFLIGPLYVTWLDLDCSLVERSLQQGGHFWHWVDCVRDRDEAAEGWGVLLQVHWRMCKVKVIMLLLLLLLLLLSVIIRHCALGSACDMFAYESSSGQPKCRFFPHLRYVMSGVRCQVSGVQYYAIPFNILSLSYLFSIQLEGQKSVGLPLSCRRHLL